MNANCFGFLISYLVYINIIYVLVCMPYFVMSMKKCTSEEHTQMKIQIKPLNQQHAGNTLISRYCLHFCDATF